MKKQILKKPPCYGCLSIENYLFPFVKKGEQLYIDQEGCGVDGQDYLRVGFCPTCGRKLRVSKSNQ